MSGERAPAVWFPTVRTGSGTDVFTERLAAVPGSRGVEAGVAPGRSLWSSSHMLALHRNEAF